MATRNITNFFPGGENHPIDLAEAVDRIDGLGAVRMWTGTETAYQAIVAAGNIDPNTLYFRSA